MMNLHLVGEYKINPIYRCATCGHELWEERSERTGHEDWLVTRDGRRHYRTRCNLPAAADARPDDTVGGGG